MPSNVGALEMQYILSSLERNDYDERVESYLDGELVGDTQVAACVTGARCWTHRDKGPEWDCGMRTAPKDGTTCGTRLTIIFDDHIAHAEEPQLVCGFSWEHNQIHNRPTMRIDAIRHSCVRFPTWVSKTSSTSRRKRCYRIKCCGGLNPNLFKAWSRTRQLWEILYKITNTVFITADALIMVNNNVWDAFAGTPCMFLYRVSTQNRHRS